MTKNQLLKELKQINDLMANDEIIQEIEENKNNNLLNSLIDKKEVLENEIVALELKLSDDSNYPSFSYMANKSEIERIRKSINDAKLQQDTNSNVISKNKNEIISVDKDIESTKATISQTTKRIDEIGKEIRALGENPSKKDSDRLSKELVDQRTLLDRANINLENLNYSREALLTEVNTLTETNKRMDKMLEDLQIQEKVAVEADKQDSKKPVDNAKKLHDMARLDTLKSNVLSLSTDINSARYTALEELNLLISEVEADSISDEDIVATVKSIQKKLPEPLLSKNYEKYEGELEINKAQQIELSNQISELETKLSDTINYTPHIFAQEVMDQEVSDLEKNIAEQEYEIRNAELRISDYENRISSNEVKISHEEDKIQRVEAVKDELKFRLTDASLSDEDHRMLVSQYKSINRNIDKSRKQIDRLNKNISTLETSISNTKKEKKEIENMRISDSKDLESLRSNLDDRKSIDALAMIQDKERLSVLKASLAALMVREDALNAVYYGKLDDISKNYTIKKSVKKDDNVLKTEINEPKVQVLNEVEPVLSTVEPIENSLDVDLDKVKTLGTVNNYVPDGSLTKEEIDALLSNFKVPDLSVNQFSQSEDILPISSEVTLSSENEPSSDIQYESIGEPEVQVSNEVEPEGINYESISEPEVQVSNEAEPEGINYESISEPEVQVSNEVEPEGINYESISEPEVQVSNEVEPEGINYKSINEPVETKNSSLVLNPIYDDERADHYFNEDGTLTAEGFTFGMVKGADFTHPEYGDVAPLSNLITDGKVSVTTKDGDVVDLPLSELQTNRYIASEPVVEEKSEELGLPINSDEREAVLSEINKGKMFDSTSEFTDQDKQTEWEKSYSDDDMRDNWLDRAETEGVYFRKDTSNNPAPSEEKSKPVGIVAWKEASTDLIGKIKNSEFLNKVKKNAVRLVAMAGTIAAILAVKGCVDENLSKAPEDMPNIATDLDLDHLDDIFTRNNVIDEPEIENEIPETIEPVIPVTPEPVQPVIPVTPKPVQPVVPVTPEPVEPVIPVTPEPVEPVIPVTPEPIPPVVPPIEPPYIPEEPKPDEPVVPPVEPPVDPVVPTDEIIVKPGESLIVEDGDEAVVVDNSNGENSPIIEEENDNVNYDYPESDVIGDVHYDDDGDMIVNVDKPEADPNADPNYGPNITDEEKEQLEKELAEQRAELEAQKAALEAQKAAQQEETKGMGGK